MTLNEFKVLLKLKVKLKYYKLKLHRRARFNHKGLLYKVPDGIRTYK